VYLPKDYIIKEGFEAERSFATLFSITFRCVAFYPQPVNGLDLLRVEHFIL